MKKHIAWGTSLLLKIYVKETGAAPFSYCIDDFTDLESVYGLPVKKSDSLKKEKPGTFQIVVFAVSSRSLQQIFAQLSRLNLNYGSDFILYSDFFYDAFVNKFHKYLGWTPNERIHKFAHSFILNSQVLTDTTILGTWLFLEMINRLDRQPGAIAEVGAFQGGNALCALQYMVSAKQKSFYILDSFQGFPEPGAHDPKNVKKGDYKIESSYQEIVNMFSPFPSAVLVKGFVPESFEMIPKQENFSLVFYDCDLYEPASASFDFFWDKIVPGGYMLIHDYVAEEDGFAGVKKATDEFFVPKNIPIFYFPENTMAVVQKPKHE